jgi:hypothetical protein
MTGNHKSNILASKTLIMALSIQILLSTVFVSTLPIQSANAQNSTGANATVSSSNTETTLMLNGKSLPIKYSLTTGKLLGIVADKDKTTLVGVISSPVDKGTLRIELPRNVIDDKGQGNNDAKFTVHVDGKDATFREVLNNPTTRVLAIDFNKDARLIEIVGTTPPL